MLRVIPKQLFILITVLFVSSVTAEIGQDNQNIPLNYLPAIKGDYFKLDSRVIGRAFHIYIRLPENYQKAQATQYPIAYLLDGDSLFPILAANHLFLTYDDKLPESIVVGISYGSFDPKINKRGFDFSTHSSNSDKDLGGAKDFLTFLKTELIPLVEQKYKADKNKRIIFGQSRGGYMVLYSAFSDPDLFWGRIASNPTFMPNKEQFYGTPAKSERKDLHLVVSSGSHDYPTLRQAALDWHSSWGQRANTPWDIHFKTIENGTHSANSLDSYRFGMNVIFGTRQD
ncbi:alpha/beta hydrolase [Catenovulum sp. SM1970]|uniref:alpha/beta hydrolase n=1 Tax=Marinifaba aquimaris TaxID=2741323 RepID=UPI00157412E0|nr:alpha/beta hydrolase-fold protein [Marinifaba aquimaris]NTS76818.1 alpha/beta hydrolase [Marinifaba aquimaris]